MSLDQHPFITQLRRRPNQDPNCMPHPLACRTPTGEAVLTALAEALKAAPTGFMQSGILCQVNPLQSSLPCLNAAPAGCAASRRTSATSSWCRVSCLPAVRTEGKKGCAAKPCGAPDTPFPQRTGWLPKFSAVAVSQRRPPQPHPTRQRRLIEGQHKAVDLQQSRPFHTLTACTVMYLVLGATRCEDDPDGFLQAEAPAAAGAREGADWVSRDATYLSGERGDCCLLHNRAQQNAILGLSCLAVAGSMQARLEVLCGHMPHAVCWH